MLRDRRRSPKTSLFAEIGELELDPRETSLEPQIEAGTHHGRQNCNRVLAKKRANPLVLGQTWSHGWKKTDRTRPREEDLLLWGIARLEPDQSVLRAKCNARNRKVVLIFWCAKSNIRNVRISSISWRNKRHRESDGHVQRSSPNRPCANKKSRRVGAARKEKHRKQRLYMRKLHEQQVVAGVEGSGRVE